MSKQHEEQFKDLKNNAIFEKYFQYVFNIGDTDNKGYLVKSELLAVMNTIALDRKLEMLDDHAVNDLWGEISVDNKINKNQFKSFFKDIVRENTSG